MSKGSIVIVEDDDDQRSNYEKLLTRRQYSVHAFATKEDALQHLQLHRPDLLILDIILGDDYNGGFDVYNQAVRLHEKLPVLFLTDLDSELDKVVGLRMGAWDYQPKPISMEYLAAKVQTLMMLSQHLSSQQKIPEKELVRGELTLNMSSRRATWAGQKIASLTVTEFNMLHALVRYPDQVITYEKFAKVTHSSVIEKNTISVHIRNLKRKISKVAPDFNCIESQYGTGYRWKA